MGAQKEEEEPACGHASTPHLGPSIHPPQPRAQNKAQEMALHESIVTALSLPPVPVDLEIWQT